MRPDPARPGALAPWPALQQMPGQHARRARPLRPVRRRQGPGRPQRQRHAGMRSLRRRRPRSPLRHLRSARPSLHAGQVRALRLQERLSDLLAGPDGTISFQLQPVAQALAPAQRPRSLLNWLERSPNAKLLAQLAAAGEPLSHELLDELPPGRHEYYVRQTLVTTGNLPERHDDLERLPSWLNKTLANHPAEHARLIRHSLTGSCCAALDDERQPDASPPTPTTTCATGSPRRSSCSSGSTTTTCRWTGSINRSWTTGWPTATPPPITFATSLTGPPPETSPRGWSFLFSLGKILSESSTSSNAGTFFVAASTARRCRWISGPPQLWSCCSGCRSRASATSPSTSSTSVRPEPCSELVGTPSSCLRSSASCSSGSPTPPTPELASPAPPTHHAGCSLVSLLVGQPAKTALPSSSALSTSMPALHATPRSSPSPERSRPPCSPTSSASRPLPPRGGPALEPAERQGVRFQDPTTARPPISAPASTVHGVLARHDLCRLAWLDRPTAALIRRPGRYQGARSGELAHVDVKRPGRLRDGGWPFTAATAWPPVKPATGPGSAWTTPTPTNHRHPRPR